MIELHKYLREKGFVCSYRNADRASFWKSTEIPYYWQIDLDGSWIKVTKFSNEDIKFSELCLQNAQVSSIAELAVIIEILNIR